MSREDTSHGNRKIVFCFIFQYNKFKDMKKNVVIVIIVFVLIITVALALIFTKYNSIINSVGFIIIASISFYNINLKKK